MPILGIYSFIFNGLVARPPGFEPGTDGLEGRCSIQLSYGRGAVVGTLVDTAPRQHRAGPPEYITAPGKGRVRGSQCRGVSAVGLDQVFRGTTRAKIVISRPQRYYCLEDPGGL